LARWLGGIIREGGSIKIRIGKRKRLRIMIVRQALNHLPKTKLPHKNNPPNNNNNHHPFTNNSNPKSTSPPIS
jgi:hypothetical protein